MEEIQKQIANIVSELMPQLCALSDEIFDYAEPGYEEYRSSAALTKWLRAHDFEVTIPYAGLDTAFCAVYRHKGGRAAGGRAIGFLGEYDALRGQGHGCAHHNAGEIIDKHPRGFAPSTTAILKNISSNNQRYCFYAMKYLEQFIRSNTVGMGVPHVDGDYLKSLRFITPSNADQERLANYLDRKISVIDSILDSKDELINLLYEQRVGIISQAVTKGLYPDSAMKDCGVKWLGQVPAHWQVLTNHQLFAERNIKCTEPDAVLLSVTKHLGVILQSQAEELNLATVAPAETTEGYKVVHKGDLVMNIMRAKDGSYGISGYDGVISPAYCIYYPRQEVNPQYLYYLFKTPMYMEIFKNYSTGIAEHRMRLYPVNFFKIPAVVPPLEEQNEIVVYLNKRVKDIDELIFLTQQQIEKLKEYRQSVISEVVTGKVAVE